MQIHARLTVLAFCALVSSFAYAVPPINIFFANQTRSDFTIKPSGANLCIDSYNTDAFTVAAGEKRTYIATLEPNCIDASISFDYSQTINPNSPETRRVINGTITYEQYTVRGVWQGKLYIELTPPVPTPRPVLFRTTCGDTFLFCATTAVALSSNHFFARFTAIPDQSFLTWGFSGLGP